MKRALIFLLVIISLQTFGQKYPKREMRATWLATVRNIDWPVSNTQSSGEQIAHLVQIFDSLEACNINAVFFQVRTECDALYESAYEPWSWYVSGKQGKAPEPYYDPLQFAIDEAHKRGIELHAWLNPYRAVVETGYFEPAPNHVLVTHPEWLMQFGKLQILDPGQPQVREYVLNVVSDLINRYDIDGIHFDDYFYPYKKITNEDSVSYARYSRGFTDIDDWRRDNINMLMSDIYEVIKSVKPHIKYGISPFGIVENHYADTDGFESYNVLYCDPLYWIENKVLDYMNPQLYWKMDHKAAPYSKLLPWWAKVTKNMHLYAGQYATYFMNDRNEDMEGELGAQLRLNRKTDNVHGVVYFSAKAIFNNWKGMADSLKNDWFKYPALPQVMEWKDKIAPNTPDSCKIVSDSTGSFVEWKQPLPAEDGQTPKYYIVYKFEKDSDMDISNPANIEAFVRNGKLSYKIEDEDKDKFAYMVTSLDRLHNESKGAVAQRE